MAGPMFKLQYFRTSAPQELLVTEREETSESPFAYTNAPAGEQAIWSSAYRYCLHNAQYPKHTHNAKLITHRVVGIISWLQGGGPPERVPEATPAELVSLIKNSGDEVARMGAGYQLGEHVAAAPTPSQASATLEIMRAVLQEANTPVTAGSLPGGAEPRGQHGCKEGILRALQ